MSTGNGGGTFSQRVTAGLTARTARTAEMSSVERSAQADAIRRQLVELTAAHNRLVALVDAQGRQMTALTDDSREHAHRIMQTSVGMAALTDVTDEQLTREKAYNALTGDLGSKMAGIELRYEFLDRSFTARIRWILTGRW